jgi:nitrous oxidase accessory protein
LFNELRVADWSADDYATKINTYTHEKSRQTGYLMVALNRKITAAVLATVLLAVCVFAVAADVFMHMSPSQPGEGYVDPASGIHITPSGDIKGSAINSSNIHRDGDVYTLTSNLTSMVTIEKSNIVLNGRGFSFVGSHGLKLTEVSNVTVKDLNIETHYLRIMLQHAKYNTIQNVTSNYELILSDSDNNLISNCSGVIRIENSDNNIIKNCITGKITLLKSNGNSILYNNISTQGPSLGLWYSSNNIVFGNTFSKFWWWIGMTGGSTNNKIVANDVWAGQLYLADKLVGTNCIYHNNFWNFKWEQTATTNSANVWSSNMQGNYWGSSWGPDANHDGVGDTPYIIDKTNKDNYPLMAPVNIATEPLP